MSKSILFDEGPDEGTQDGNTFRVNKKFAQEYEIRKQREELRNARENDDDLSSGSEEETEDEDGDLLTPSVNVSILKTINALRKKEKSIYDPNKKFFDESMMEATVGKEKVSKKKRYKDVLREQILKEMNGEEAKNDPELGIKELNSHLVYDDEQKQIRSAFLETSKDEDGKDDDNDMLIVKKKTEPIWDSDDSDYKRELEKLEKSSSSGTLKDPRGEVKDGDKFLLDFLKNKKWIEKDDESSSDEENKNFTVRKFNVDDDDSIDDVDRADDFEAKYNFRFEEAANAVNSGADFSMVGYARSGTMNTLRRKDDKRSQKRSERKERKAAERKAKEEQLRRLKNAKRQEMETKLMEIKKVIGSADENTLDEDAIMKLMEGDYDPEKFEKIMQEAYGDDFYEKEDSQWKSDADVREALLHDEDGNIIVGEDSDDKGLYDNQQEDEDYADEEYGNEEYEEEEGNEYWDGENSPPLDSKLELKLKGKIQEELYKLDYEDIIAGMPTRFKYRQVEANNYGLSTQEILFARDSTLKGFVSLKQMAPYREGSEHQVSSKKRKRFRTKLQDDIDEYAKAEGVSENTSAHEPEEDIPSKKRRRRQKKGKKKDKITAKALDKERDEQDTANSDPGSLEVEPEKSEITKRRRKKKGKKLSKNEAHHENSNDISKNENSISFSIKTSTPKDPGKKKKKRKKEKKMKIKGISEARLEAYGL